MKEKRFEVDSGYINVGENEIISSKELIKTLLNKCYKLQEENKQLKQLLKDAEDQVETLKESNKKYMESLVQLESED